MSKALFIAKTVLISGLFLALFFHSVAYSAAEQEKPVVITAQTLIADNRSNSAVFEGSVVAKTEGIIIYSDRMKVFYSDFQGKIIKINVSGNVRVHKGERAIFSQEANYFGEEEKIVFTGEPKVVDGENMIMGTEITYFLKDDRTIVKDSRVVLKKSGE